MQVAVLHQNVEYLSCLVFKQTVVGLDHRGASARFKGIARSPVLFLDEPTIGLDAISKLAVRDFVRRLNRSRGVTVILTAHDLDDIEALCQRVMVIGSGKLLCDGTLEYLRRSVSRERRLTIDLASDADSVSDPDATVVRREGHRVCLGFDPERISPAALITRILASHAVVDLFVENPPIENIVAQLYDSAAAAVEQGA